MSDFMDRPAYQRAAIIAAQQKRREELDPIRNELDQMIHSIGWRKARPVVEQVMGFPVSRQRGNWWAAVGKRKIKALTEALRDLPRQEKLW